jgi:hypothetical protein
VGKIRAFWGTFCSLTVRQTVILLSESYLAQRTESIALFFEILAIYLAIGQIFEGQKFET